MQVVGRPWGDEHEEPQYDPAECKSHQTNLSNKKIRANCRFIDVAPSCLEPASQRTFAGLEKLLWWEKAVVVAFPLCDLFDYPTAESISREEPQVWRVEELLRSPAHLMI